MSNERVYNMPATDQEVQPVDVVEQIANVTEDVASLVKTHEARMHMVNALRHLRWAEAAERQTMGVVS